MYKLNNFTTLSGQEFRSIIRTTDNTFIPYDESNIDYKKYLEWLAEGNTPEPSDE
jgi:hypothetical protein